MQRFSMCSLPSGFPTKMLSEFLISSCMLHAPPVSYSMIICREEYKLQISSLSNILHPSFLDAKILLSSMLSNTLNLCFSPLRDKISHHTNTGKYYNELYRKYSGKLHYIYEIQILVFCPSQIYITNKNLIFFLIFRLFLCIMQQNTVAASSHLSIHNLMLVILKSGL